MNAAVRERKYEKTYALELLRIAEGDFDSASRLLGTGPVRLENVFYLAEQAIEKALKALLCASGKSIPYTHNLGVLLERLPEDIEFPFILQLDELNEFATVRRYEEGAAVLEVEEAEEVLEVTKKLLKWAKQKINGYLK